MNQKDVRVVTMRLECVVVELLEERMVTRLLTCTHELMRITHVHPYTCAPPPLFGSNYILLS